MPGIVKIGCTERSPLRRSKELSSSTSVPCEFDIFCYGEVEDFAETEKMMHEIFMEYRVSTGREFFYADNVHKVSMARLLEEYSYHFMASDFLSFLRSDIETIETVDEMHKKGEFAKKLNNTVKMENKNG